MQQVALGDNEEIDEMQQETLADKEKIDEMLHWQTMRR